LQQRTAPEALKDHVHGHLLTRSAGRAWNNVLVQLLSHDPLEKSLLVPAVAEPLLVWIVSGAASIEERELEGDWHRNDVSVGDFFLTNSPTPYEMRWKSRSGEPFEVLHLYLGLPIFEAALAEVFGENPNRRLQLRDISGKRDERLSSLLEMIRVELTDTTHEPSEMYVQGLAHALSIHLVRSYTDSSLGTTRRGALPAFKLRRVAELMEGALDREFSLGALAFEAGLSTFHFSRVFKQSTGFSPSEYFIRLRMTEARRLLRETDKSIIAIGLDVGYSSPSHFAQVFKRAVGVSPSDYRA
jgi:AraC family transcriptional regulator